MQFLHASSSAAEFSTTARRPAGAIGHVETDSFGHVLEWGKDMETMFGISRAEALHQFLPHLIAASLYNNDLEQAFDSTAARNTRNFALMGRHAAGNEFPLEVWVDPPEHGATLFSVWIRQVVNELPAELTGTAEETAAPGLVTGLSDLVELAPMGICSFDSAGIVLSWNSACERILGWSAAEVLGKKLPIALDSRTADFGGMRNLLLAGESFSDLESVENTKLGQPVDVSISAVPLRNAADDIYGAMAIITDISERKRSEEEHQKFAALVENSTDFITIMSLDGRGIYLNVAGRELIGLDSMASMFETCITDFYHPSSRQRLEAEAIPQARLRGSWEGELQMRHLETQQTIDVRGSVFLVINPITQAPLCLAASFRDITQKKRDEEALKQALAQQASMTKELALAKENAELANSAKSAFLANMSHEIRTPMTAILGYSDVLLDETMTKDERQSYVEAIRRNGRHLLELINDILDISKIEAGKMDVELIPASVAMIVAEVTSMIRGRADEKKLAFRVCYDGPLPRTIKTDPTRLRQILINLLGNAVKFTETGSITLRASHKIVNGMYELRFDIIDTGLGMNPEQLGRLFAAFTQADNSTTRRFGGTGLGLHISKRLATILGGDITVTSKYGHGSTFSVHLNGGPANENDALLRPDEEPLPALPRAEEPATDGKPCGRVLLAEDGPDNQRLITMYLKKAGAQIEIADNGERAVERALAEEAAGTPFDVILMDIQMPVMDGLTAVGLLRASGYTRPVIALTAHAMPEDRRRCVDAGYTDYTTKPLKRAELISMVARYTEVSKSQPTPPAQNSQSRQKKGIPPAPQAVSQSPLSKVETIHSTYENDEDMQELLAEYVKSLPTAVADLRAAATQKDWGRVGRLVHQVKGTAGNFGFLQITEIAKGVETRLKETDDEYRKGLDTEVMISGIEAVAGYVAKEDGHA